MAAASRWVCSGAAIPIYSRIALMAQVIDVFHVANGPEAALREARNRSGTWFDPELVAAFERIAARPAFWDMLRSDDEHEAALPQPPEQASVPIDEDYLDDIAAAFAQVVDSKSPYTSGHSERVTLFTDMIAEQLEFSAEQRRWLKRAALLHDIGKLGVSNAILDKPGKLDDAEWEIMRMHSAHSEAILSRIGAFSELAPIAGAHHERLDGKGYPRGLVGRPDLPGNPNHHHGRHLRCAHRRAPLSRRDADHKSAGDHVRNGRHPDRCGLLCGAHPRAWTHRRDAGRLIGTLDLG